MYRPRFAFAYPPDLEMERDSRNAGVLMDKQGIFA